MKDNEKFKFISFTIEKTAIEDVLIPINSKKLKDNPILKLTLMDKETGILYYFEDSIDTTDFYEQCYTQSFDGTSADDTTKQNLERNALWFFYFLVPVVEGEIQEEPITLQDGKSKSTSLEKSPYALGLKSRFGTYALEKNQLNKVVGTHWSLSGSDSKEAEYRYITYKYPTKFEFDGSGTFENDLTDFIDIDDLTSINNKGILASEYIIWSYKKGYIEPLKTHVLGSTIDIKSTIAIEGTGINLYDINKNKHALIQYSEYDGRDTPFLGPHNFELRNVGVTIEGRSGEILYTASTTLQGKIIEETDNLQKKLTIINSLYGIASNFLPDFITNTETIVSSVIDITDTLDDSEGYSSVLDPKNGEELPTTLEGHLGFFEDMLVAINTYSVKSNELILSNYGDKMNIDTTFIIPSDAKKYDSIYKSMQSIKDSNGQYGMFNVIFSFDLYYRPYSKIADELLEGSPYVHIFTDERYKPTLLRSFNQQIYDQNGHANNNIYRHELKYGRKLN